jgi:hypothetical protein
MSKLKISLAKRELYESIRAQVRDQVQGDDREIRRAERQLQNFFKKRWKRSSFAHLRKKIESSDLIFWADFHGVRQFQKNLLRWLKSLNLQKRPLALALECLPVTAQKQLELYRRGHLTESDFLKKIKWDQVWGFPWSHYKPLFDWAREAGVPIIAVNEKGTSRSSRSRERKALSVIQNFLERNTEAQVICLYGEHHLIPRVGFDRSLRTSFWTKRKILQVFQNSDDLYFRHPPRVERSEGEVFKLDDRNYCLQNVSPWMKWQSYYLFLESSSEGEFEDDLDLTDYVLGLARVLSESLEIPLDLNRVSVLTSQDRLLWESLRKMRDEEAYLFQSLIRESLSFVRSDSGWSYLSRISANEAAGLAFEILLFQMNSNLKWIANHPAFWDFVIWVKSFSYFGSKVINPHRKSTGLIELQKKAKNRLGRPLERQAARLVLSYTLHQSLSKKFDWGDSAVSDSVRFQAAKWISGVIGEKIFRAHERGLLSLATLKSFLAKDPRDDNFHIVIQQFFELIDHDLEN